MAEVKWTRRAIRDLQSIYEYVSIDSAFYAERLADKISSRVDQLIAHPLSGRVLPEKEDATLRELIEGNYRIFYKVLKSKVYGLRIHHAARQIK